MLLKWIFLVTYSFFSYACFPSTRDTIEKFPIFNDEEKSLDPRKSQCYLQSEISLREFIICHNTFQLRSLRPRIS